MRKAAWGFSHSWSRRLSCVSGAKTRWRAWRCKCRASMLGCSRDLMQGAATGNLRAEIQELQRVRFLFKSTRRGTNEFPAHCSSSGRIEIILSAFSFDRCEGYRFIWILYLPTRALEGEHRCKQWHSGPLKSCTGHGRRGSRIIWRGKAALRDAVRNQNYYCFMPCSTEKSWWTGWKPKSKNIVRDSNKWSRTLFHLFTFSGRCDLLLLDLSQMGLPLWYSWSSLSGVVPSRSLKFSSISTDENIVD